MKILVRRLMALVLLFGIVCSIPEPIRNALRPVIAVRVTKVQTGLASFYAEDFHGNTTANGERFNMYEMTAAHPWLPFGTLLLVKNLLNKKICIVRVNDRGPYRDSSVVDGDTIRGYTGPTRVIDLSYKAAQEIDAVRDGVVPVEVALINGTQSARNVVLRHNSTGRANTARHKGKNR